MSGIVAEELNEIYRFAIDLAKDAGDMLLAVLTARREGVHLADGEHEPSIKENAADIVTKTDYGRYRVHGLNGVKKSSTQLLQLNLHEATSNINYNVEHFLHNKIASKYPGHAFLGEESYSKGSSRAYIIDRKTPTWVVDPLDGTVNFTHAFPMFCVSISLVLHDKPIVGVIYAPLMSQLFSACRGKGAWLNETFRLPYLGKSIGPIPRDAPSQCVFGGEWGKDRRDSPEGNLQKKVQGFVNMAAERKGRGGKGGMVHGIRSLGSAALDLAYVAMGGIDIWHEAGCWEWDVAAGICLVEEAGGLVTTANPPEDLESAEIKDAHLGGRLYLAIRPAFDSAVETARESQERAVREVWKRVVHIDYLRPGVE